MSEGAPPTGGPPALAGALSTQAPDPRVPDVQAQALGSRADASSAEPALRVRKFSKSYGETRAVEELEFEVRPGEILGLVGPNGAGKTTTLRSIAGVLPVTPGHIRVAGHDMGVAGEETEAKRSLAWIPDDPQPYDSLTVEEHLRFTASLYGVRDWRERAPGLLERFELTEKQRALGGELSRGMRQKLAFAQAWLHRPRVLLMDEPLSGLDPRGIRVAKSAIREIAAEGTAVVLSSHLLNLIEELGTHLLILDRGRRLFTGTLAAAHAALAGDSGAKTLEELFFAATGEES